MLALNNSNASLKEINELLSGIDVETELGRLDVKTIVYILMKNYDKKDHWSESATLVLHVLNEEKKRNRVASLEDVIAFFKSSKKLVYPDRLEEARKNKREFETIMFITIKILEFII